MQIMVLFRRAWFQSKLVYPLLIIWWLWTSMAVCYAMQSSVPMEMDSDPVSVHAHHNSSTDMSGDCCDDAELVCCDQQPVIQSAIVEHSLSEKIVKASAHFALALPLWFYLDAPPLSGIFTVDFTRYPHQSSYPRQHLLNCCFLD